jgi:very-short-patch-repair endonuclease
MLWGIPLPRRLGHEYTTHIAVPAPATAPVGRGITGHSYRVVDRELTTLNGLRLSTPARTWCELSFVLSVDELIIAGDYLIHHERDLTSPYDLALLVQRFPSRTGRATRLHALRELHDRSESPQETRLRLLVSRARLGGLEVNFPISTSGGFHYRADLAFPALRVVIEYQSAFHDSPARIQSDRTRRSRLEADQWRVIEVGSEDLRSPDELLTRLRRTLATRSGLATFAP